MEDRMAGHRARTGSVFPSHLTAIDMNTASTDLFALFVTRSFRGIVASGRFQALCSSMFDEYASGRIIQGQLISCESDSNGTEESSSCSATFRKGSSTHGTALPGGTKTTVSVRERRRVREFSWIIFLRMKRTHAQRSSVSIDWRAMMQRTDNEIRVSTAIGVIVLGRRLFRHTRTFSMENLR